MLASVLMMFLQAAPVPMFSAQVQMVGVTVNAVDFRSGKPVAGLTAADFQVFEEGKRQQMLHFQQEDVPASVLILLDASTSMRGLLPAVKEAAGRLVRSLRPIDEVHVAAFDDRYQILSDFTTDHEAAACSIHEVRQGRETALNMALYTAARFLERRFHTETERRRIIILLSDGEDTHRSLSYEAVQDVFQRSTIVCYVVHLQRQYFPNSQSVTLGDRAKQFVDTLVYETGGRLVTVPYPYESRAVAGAFSDIATELGTQYYLAYASPADARQSGWRAINVMMTSRSDVKLRFRRGYYVAPKR